MGAGKSTIGRQLAKALHRKFYDSDKVIEKRTGVSISWIFEMEGESGFRDRESKAIDELTDFSLSKLLNDIHHSSAILNYCHTEAGYSDALGAQRAKIKDSELTPSGRMLREMRKNKLSFFEFSIERSKITQQWLLSSALDKRTLTEFIGASELSLKKQAEIEASDTLDFESYLADWNSN